MSLIIPANSAAVGGGYDVDNSVRVNRPDGAYMSGTNGTATNNNKYTISFWTKRGRLSNGSILNILEGYAAANDTGTSSFIWGGTDAFVFSAYNVNWRITNRLFRDSSAYYHIVVAVDTTLGTADDRIKIYINGVQETSFSTKNNPSQNANTGLNNNSANMNFFRRRYSSSNDNHGDGYFSEFCMIDGQALDPTSFGEFHEDSGIWKPIDVSGLTFGTNGFYLDFEDSAALGDDVSGNGNDFTVNNLTAIDQSTDTPTNNFATLNPLHYNINNTTENGNLTWDSTSYTGSDYPLIFSTIGATKGKWYVECKFISGNSVIGISPSDENISSYLGSTANSYGYYASSTVINNNQQISGYAGYSQQAIIGIGLDLDNNKLYFSTNGTWENSGDPESGSTGTGALSLASDKTWLFAIGSGGGSQNLEMNFGSPPYSESGGNSDGNGYGNFNQAVPNGYYALNTKNLSEFG